MRKPLMLTIALFAAVPMLGGSAAAASTKSCGGQFKIRAHGLSCKAANRNLSTGSMGFACRQVGHSTRPPFTIRCKKNKHPNVFYTYETQGG